MKGDFSRITFDPAKHYSGVRMQQGRVQLDADWNEQVDILNHHLQVYLKDLLNSGAAPRAAAGFKITMRNGANFDSEEHEHIQHLGQDDSPHFDFSIGGGRYYADGILCENEQETLFTAQPGSQALSFDKHKHYAVVYLDAWQRHITAFEDGTLRETALGGVDTTTRIQNVWQVRVLPVGNHHALVDSDQVTAEAIPSLSEWHEMLNHHRHKGRMQARCIPHSTTLDNQLYRVEIHDADIHGKKAIFKWSRENGSVVFDVEQLEQAGKLDANGDVQLIITLGDLGRDTVRLQKGDWVELVNDESLLNSLPMPLYQVKHVPDFASRKVTLSGQNSATLAVLAQNLPEHLLLRRWDRDTTDPAAPGTFPVQEEQWLDLERDIQVCFAPDGTYAAGDYWLIPARTLTENIEWPSDKNGPLALPPQCTKHSYSPLALLHLENGTWNVAKDLRQLFDPLPLVSALTEKLAALPPEIDIVEIMTNSNQKNLSEECRSDDALTVGDVVSLVPGTSTNPQVTLANKDNARMIFGIVSGEREEDGEKRFRVTTYGRARCKVTGSIEAGHLLTASEVAGCATKTGFGQELFRPGAILGKALDAYEPDDSDIPGVIDVMVTLQ